MHIFLIKKPINYLQKRLFVLLLVMAISFYSD